jgi:hypothetical protein
LRRLFRSAGSCFQSVFSGRILRPCRFNLSHDLLYLMDSERPLGRRYADLCMIARPEARQYRIFDFLLEFKFVKPGEGELSGEAIRALGTGRTGRTSADPAAAGRCARAGRGLPGRIAQAARCDHSPARFRHCGRGLRPAGLGRGRTGIQLITPRMWRRL